MLQPPAVWAWRVGPGPAAKPCSISRPAYGPLAAPLQPDPLGSPAAPSRLQGLLSQTHPSCCPSLPPAGLDREPELLQHLFACLSLICKHLVKALSSEEQLLRMLRATQRLRHHRAEHVRALAAEALGFLLRQAGHAVLALLVFQGVRLVLEDGGQQQTAGTLAQASRGLLLLPASWRRLACTLLPARCPPPFKSWALQSVQRCQLRSTTHPAAPCRACRQASGPAVKVGIKAALAEAVSRPNDARVHAAGALLAEAVTGVSHGLHSRTAAVLGPLLRDDILRPEDFKSAKVRLPATAAGAAGIRRPERHCDLPAGKEPLAGGATGWPGAHPRRPRGPPHAANPAAHPAAAEPGRRQAVC